MWYLGGQKTSLLLSEHLHVMVSEVRVGVWLVPEGPHLQVMVLGVRVGVWLVPD